MYLVRNNAQHQSTCITGFVLRNKWKTDGFMSFVLLATNLLWKLCAIYLLHLVLSLKLEHSFIYKAPWLDEDVVFTLYTDRIKNGTSSFGVNQSESYFKIRGLQYVRNGTHLLRRDAAKQSRDFVIGLNHRRKRSNKTDWWRIIYTKHLTESGNVPLPEYALTEIWRNTR